MIPTIVGLIALNALTVYLHGRHEARLIDALKTNTPGEYIAVRRAENKPAKTAKTPIDEDALNIHDMHPIGL